MKSEEIRSFSRRTKKSSRLVLPAVVLAGLPLPLDASVIAVNWTGDYVQSSSSLDGDTVPGAGTYEDPDSSGAGAGALAGRAFSWSAPFSPAAPYGSFGEESATFFGGAVAMDVDGTGNDGFDELAVINQGGNDSLHFRVQSDANSQHTLDALFIWTKNSFLNGMDSVSNLDLSGDGFFHFDTSQSGGGHNDGSFTLRWVVANGSANSLFVSPLTALGSNLSITQAFSLITGWESWAVAENNLASLQFDATGAAFGTASSSLTDIRGLGFLIEHTSPTGPVHVHIEHFQVGLVPEPSVAALLSGVALISSRRRRQNCLRFLPGGATRRGGESVRLVD